MWNKSAHNVLVATLLSLFLILPTSCNEAPPTAPKGPPVIMPLAIGNKWSGKETTYGPNDSVISQKWKSFELVDTGYSQWKDVVQVKSTR